MQESENELNKKWKFDFSVPAESGIDIKRLKRFLKSGDVLIFYGGEPLVNMKKMVEIAKKIIPENRIIYLMGTGEPLEILEVISMGVDMFDSRFPTQNARRGTLFTWKGKIKIFNKKYETDITPIDKNCNCFACKNYSKAYIRYLLKQEEGLGYRLASYHNIYFMTNLIEKAKEEIKKGKFDEFLKRMRRTYK